MQNKNTAKIFLRVGVFVLKESLAPILAVKMLVQETKKIINKFAYPREKGGSPSILLPVIENIVTPENAMKNPITEEVPTALCKGIEKELSVGTLKLPPPIPIKTERKPIILLIVKLIINFFGKDSLIVINFF